MCCNVSCVHVYRNRTRTRHVRPPRISVESHHVSAVPADLHGVTVQPSSSTVSQSSAADATDNFIASQANQISQLTREVLELRQQIHSLSEQLRLTTRFSYASISTQPEVVLQFTGLSVDAFQVLVCMASKLQPINYYLGGKVVSLGVADQILMGLMKLKRNYTHVDLAMRFGISSATVKNVVLTWISVLHEMLFDGLLGAVGIPSQLKNQSSLPSSFSSFSNCRIVVDCTEVQIAVPRNSMSKQNSTWSHYKQRNTFKGLIGVAPNACITFVSKLYPGSTSDKQIVQHCGVLQQLNSGDLILADKGFVIQDIVPPGVFVNVPPFLLKSQFTPQEVMCTKRIARARIHVQRAIERIKGFQILRHIPVHFRPWASKIFQLCA